MGAETHIDYREFNDILRIVETQLDLFNGLLMRKRCERLRESDKNENFSVIMVNNSQINNQITKK